MIILRKISVSLAAGVFVALMVATLGGQSAETADEQPGNGGGAEVLTRGPIHEAFAEPTSPKPSASPIIPKKPPEPINELPPEEQPAGNQAQWIPGYWAWDDDRQDFLWVSGIWRVPPPDLQWVPGYWQQVSGGERWIAGYWGPRNQTSVQLLPEPPAPVAAAIPPQPSVETVFAPGVWVYKENRYWWRPGHWVAFRPGWIWVPAHYIWTPGGYVFVAGHWDHDLDNRGLTFAPVFFVNRAYVRPGWFYRPRFTLATDIVLGSLFVNIGWSHYYFGDFYDAAYLRRGFTPWVDFRPRANVYDPLFSYYRWTHRADPRWEPNLRAVYVTRRENVALRPPKTLALQARLEVKQRVAAPIGEWKGTAFKLEPVSKVRAEEIHKATQDWHNFSKERGRIETQVKVTTPAKVNPAVKIELPKLAVKHPEVHRAPPPHPELPKLKERIEEKKK
jgi:hypothetical protein